MKRFKHGMSGGKCAEYRIWNTMKGRCLNPRNKDYPKYGGRGVTVYLRWHDFMNFFADMGRRPSPSHTVDRINNDGNYEPENCRWATMAEQCSHRKTCRYLEVDGKVMTITQWERHVGMNKGIIRQRLRLGWPAALAVSTQPRKQGIEPKPI